MSEHTCFDRNHPQNLKHWLDLPLACHRKVEEIHGPTMENPQWRSQAGCWLQLDALDLMRPDLLGAPAKKWSPHPLNVGNLSRLSHQTTRSSRDQAGIKQGSSRDQGPLFDCPPGATPGPHDSVLDGQKDSKRSDGSEHHDHSPLEMETSKTFKQWKSLWSSRI